MTSKPGCGEYTVGWINRFTGFGTDISAQAKIYELGFGYELSETSTATLVLDLESGCSLEPEPIRLRDELTITRLGDDEPFCWQGPITNVSDSVGGPLTITGRDRSWWVGDGYRGWRSTRQITGDPALLVEQCFREANIVDPTGITEFEVFPVGGTMVIDVEEGKAIGDTLSDLEVAAPWTVVGSTVYIGDLTVDRNVKLEYYHFAADLDGNNLLDIVDDGSTIVTKANVEDEDGVIHTFPTGVDYEPNFHGGFMERYYSLSQPAASAQRLAKSIVERSQHGLFIGSGNNESTVEVSERWPIDLQDTRCGYLLSVDAKDLGSRMDIGDVAQLSKVDIEVKDGAEVSMSVGLSPQMTTTDTTVDTVAPVEETL